MGLQYLLRRRTRSVPFRSLLWATIGCYAQAQAQSHIEWVSMIEWPGALGSTVQDMIVDAEGNTFFIGRDNVLASYAWQMGKLGSDGDTMWLYRPDASPSPGAEISAHAIDRDGNGGLLALVGMGYSNSLFIGGDTIAWRPDGDVALMKFSTDTILDWYLQLPSPAHYYSCLMAALPDGSSYVAGILDDLVTVIGTDTFELGFGDERNGYLTHVSANGEVLWTRIFSVGTDYTTYEDESMNHLTVDGAGRAHVQWAGENNTPENISVVDTTGALISEDGFPSPHAHSIRDMMTNSNGDDYFIGVQTLSPFAHFLGTRHESTGIVDITTLDPQLWCSQIDCDIVCLTQLALDPSEEHLFVGGCVYWDTLAWQGQVLQDEFIILGFDTVGTPTHTF